MPEKAKNPEYTEQVKELTERLETGIKDLFSSDKYKDYLITMSRFHNYSARNIMLIKLQRPDATLIAPYDLWKKQFNRQVKKGEQALRIYAPVGGNKPEKKMMEKLDPETGAPLLDDNGNVITEEMTTLTNGPRFKLVPVFAYEQTFGEPLPQVVEDLYGNVEHYKAFVDALEAVSPLPIMYEKMDTEQDGCCRFGDKIAIREGMSEKQTVSAILHEITHARLHDKEKMAVGEKAKPKAVREIEAESCAFVCAAKFGVDTGANSFGYLSTWGSHDLKEFKASLDTIRNESNALICEIEDHFKSIRKERQIDLTPKKQEEPAPVTEKTPELTYTTETRTENIAGVDFEFHDIIPETKAHDVTITKQTIRKIDVPDIMPDPSISVSERDLFGYRDDSMLPLTAKKSIEYFNSGATVYLLNTDNTEAAALDISDIENHGGIFGIDREDWLASKEYAAMSAKAKENETRPIDVEVYRHPTEIAKAHGDLDLYRQSFKLNKECAAAIDRAINAEANREHTKNAVKAVVSEYGKDRLNWVLANTIQQQHYDSRYSSDNKSWAKGFDIPKGVPDFSCKIHPALLNSFINQYRKTSNRKPSLMDSLNAAERKSKEMFGGKDAPGAATSHKDTQKSERTGD